MNNKHNMKFLILMVTFLSVSLVCAIGEANSAWISPSTSSVATGSSVNVNVSVNPATDSYFLTLELTFNSTKLSLVSAEVVPSLTTGWDFSVNQVEGSKLTLMGYTLSKPFKGNTEVAKLTFHALTSGSAALALNKVEVNDPNPITLLQGATITVTVACVPLTTCPTGKTCGSISDSCSGTISCGTCPTEQSCNSSNQCASSPAPAGATTAINCTQKSNWNNISCLGTACDSNSLHNVTWSYLLPDEQSKKESKTYGSRNGCCAKGECGSVSQSCALAGYIVPSGVLKGTICSDSDWWVCNSSLKDTLTSDKKYKCNGTAWVAYTTPQDTKIQVDFMRMYVFLHAVDINFTDKSLKEYVTIASALKTYFDTNDVSNKMDLLIKPEKKVLLEFIQAVLTNSNLNSLQKVSKIAYALSQY